MTHEPAHLDLPGPAVREALAAAGWSGATRVGPALWAARSRDGEACTVVFLRRAALGPELDDRVARLRTVAHAHVAPVTTVVEAAGEVGVVQRGAVGVALADVLARRPGLGAREVVALVVPVAQALAALHDAGLVHGPLDAGDVVVDDDGRAHLRPRVLPAGPHAVRHDDVRALAALARRVLDEHAGGSDDPALVPLGDGEADAVAAVLRAVLSPPADTAPIEAGTFAARIAQAAPAEPIRTADPAAAAAAALARSLDPGSGRVRRRAVGPSGGRRPVTGEVRRPRAARPRAGGAADPVSRPGPGRAARVTDPGPDGRGHRVGPAGDRADPTRGDATRVDATRVDATRGDGERDGGAGEDVVVRLRREVAEASRSARRTDARGGLPRRRGPLVGVVAALVGGGCLAVALVVLPGGHGGSADAGSPRAAGTPSKAADLGAPAGPGGTAARTPASTALTAPAPSPARTGPGTDGDDDPDADPGQAAAALTRARVRVLAGQLAADEVTVPGSPARATDDALVRELAGRGRFVDVPVVEVTAARVVGVTDATGTDATATVDVTYAVGAGTLVAPDGARATVAATPARTDRLVLAWTDDGWRVRTVVG